MLFRIAQAQHMPKQCGGKTTKMKYILMFFIVKMSEYTDTQTKNVRRKQTFARKKSGVKEKLESLSCK